MKNKEIQEKRMREYFIQATKEILKGEGLKSLSVRNIADRAGYSYATLYNYFKDVNDLVFLCVNDFQVECKSFVENHTGNSTEGIEKIRSSVVAYVKYFVEYPGIFDLFYLAKVGDFGNKESILRVIGNSLDDVCEKHWTHCVNQKILTPERALSLKSGLRYAVVGLLLYYLNRRTPDSYNEFMEEVNNQIHTMLS